LEFYLMVTTCIIFGIVSAGRATHIVSANLGEED